MVQFILSQLTVENILEQIFWGILLAVLGKVFLWIFSKQQLSLKKNIAYWVVVPLVFLVLSIAISASEAPNLHGRIEHLTVGESKEESGISPKAGVVLVAKVFNTGGPTIIERWQLVIETPGNQRFEVMRPGALPGKMEWVSQFKDQPRTVYYASDSLFDKTADVPLTRGAAKTGVLLFSIENASGTDISPLGTRFTLFFHDIFGGKYSASITLASQKTRPVRFPGLKSGHLAQ